MVFILAVVWGYFDPEVPKFSKKMVKNTTATRMLSAFLRQNWVKNLTGQGWEFDWNWRKSLPWVFYKIFSHRICWEIMLWVVPPEKDASQQQDYHIFSRGSRTKPSFATVTGGGTTQIILSIKIQLATKKEPRYFSLRTMENHLGCEPPRPSMLVTLTTSMPWTALFEVTIPNETYWETASFQGITQTITFFHHPKTLEVRWFQRCVISFTPENLERKKTHTFLKRAGDFS